MSPILAELIITAILLVSSCGFFYETTLFPKTRINQIGPEYWPQLLLGGMIIFSVILLVDIYLQKGKFKDKETGPAAPYPRRFWVTLMLALFYTLLLPILGFTVSTLLLCLALMWSLGIKSLKKLLVIATSSTLAIVAIFPKLMAVPLPRGTGIFRVISLFFY